MLCMYSSSESRKGEPESCNALSNPGTSEIKEYWYVQRVSTGYPKNMTYRARRTNMDDAINMKIKNE